MADKILIVDDDPAICKLLEKVMHSNELETTTVNCGMDALSILKNHTFDLILMDIMLGDMEGFEVIKRLRNQGISTPVMIVSGRNEDYDSLYGLSLGADAYITKPFSVGILKATIKNLLANRALLRQVYNSIEEEEHNFPVNCTNTLDWKFIASVKECIEKNMGDSDFNVEMLSNLHYMSRTSFFNKLKVFRRVATRYDKLAVSFLAFVHLASIWILLK